MKIMLTEEILIEEMGSAGPYEVLSRDSEACWGYDEEEFNIEWISEVMGPDGVIKKTSIFNGEYEVIEW